MLRLQSGLFPAGERSKGRNEVMQLEAAMQIQAGPYERTGKRKAHRSGTGPRSLKTIHGEIELD